MKRDPLGNGLYIENTAFIVLCWLFVMAILSAGFIIDYFIIINE